MTLAKRISLALVLAVGVAMPAALADEKHGGAAKAPAAGETLAKTEPHDEHGKGYHHLNLHAVAVQTFGFLLLAFILGKYVVPHLQSALEGRRKKIAETFDRLETDEAKLGDERADAEYAAREVERGAAERVERAIREGADLRDQLIVEGEETARKLADKAVVEREIEENMLTLELRNEAVDLSFEAAERVLAKAVDKKTQEQLVDAFIDNLGKVAR